MWRAACRSFHPHPEAASELFVQRVRPEEGLYLQKQSVLSVVWWVVFLFVLFLKINFSEDIKTASYSFILLKMKAITSLFERMFMPT